MAAVGFASYAWVIALSFVGGITNSFRKMASGAPYSGKQMLSDIAGSFGAGLFTFFMLSLAPTPAIGKAGLTLLAGFGGAAVLERALKKKQAE